MTRINNPVLTGFNPDPSICYVNGTYYIATSTFEWFPGVNIYESKDLANWKLASRPLSSAKLLDMFGNDASCGVWAPCLSYSDGKFYLVFSNIRTWAKLPFKDVKNYITTADSVDGEWSDPVYINSSGFDPSLFHDDDGKKYFVNMEWDYRSSQNEKCFSGILIQEYDAKTCSLVGERKKIFLGSERGLVEGPHIYKRNGYYYLLVAEGGTSYEHAETVCRSKNIFGQYEVHPNVHIISSLNTDATLQKAGHASLCCNDNGEWFLAHLCGRPLKNSNCCVLGRETSIQNIVWKEDWPYLKNMTIIPDDYFEVGWDCDIKTKDSFHYEFSNMDSIRDFQFLRVSPFDTGYARIDKDKKALVLIGNESPYSKHNQTLVARRQKDFCFDATVKMKFNPSCFQHFAGLSYRYDEANQYLLHLTYDEKIDKKVIRLMKTENFNTVIYDDNVTVETDYVFLKVSVSYEKVKFYYSFDGKNYLAFNGEFSSHFLSDECADPMGFTGAFVGMACYDLCLNKKVAEFYDFEYRVRSNYEKNISCFN